MTPGLRWWAEPPPRQASYLADVDPALLSVGLDTLPDDAPAAVCFRPAPADSVEPYVTALLDALDRAAVDLFPRWLPGGERLGGPNTLGVAAVRALAASLAARTDHFGPFLVSTAERALRINGGDISGGDAAAARPRFPAEVRARGLAGIIAAAYDRSGTAVLVAVPDGLTAAGQRALAAAAEWLAEHGHFTVWLAGAPLTAVDRLRQVRIALPQYLTGLAPAGVDEPALPVLSYPPLSGAPRADSAAERALERALAPYDWARGRRWNETLDWHPLGQVYRLDLFWPQDGLVVEVDGDEHRGRWKYADDRRRDARLLLLGHRVVRFTNDQVLADPQAAALTIRDLLFLRRAPLPTK